MGVQLVRADKVGKLDNDFSFFERVRDEVNNPYNGKLIKQIEINTTEDVEQALARAHALFEDRSAWLPAYKRIEILERAAQIMSDRVEELTKIAAEEDGKPYADSTVEVLRAINGVKLAIEHIPQIKGEQIWGARVSVNLAKPEDKIAPVPLQQLDILKRMGVICTFGADMSANTDHRLQPRLY